MWNETEYHNEKEERQVNSMNFKEIFGEAEWKEWIEECHITEEQLEKLKTKHTDYLMQSVHCRRGKYIDMNYFITFFQEDEIVDCVELQAYRVDLNSGWLALKNIGENLNIWKDIMDKIDECRNDGIYPARPTWKEFLRGYGKVYEETEEKLGKGGGES